MDIKFVGRTGRVTQEEGHAGFLILLPSAVRCCSKKNQNAPRPSELVDLYSVPSNIRTGPTDANTFRGHRLTTQNYYEKSRNKRTQKSQHTRHNRKKTPPKNKAPDSQTSQATCQTKEIEVEPIAPTRYARPSKIKQTRRIKNHQSRQ